MVQESHNTGTYPTIILNQVGCQSGEIMISWTRKNTDETISSLGQIQCAKPYNSFENDCKYIDISGPFDSAGAVYCPDGYFLRLLTSHDRHGYMWVW